MLRLLIQPRDLETIERQAAAAFPQECCGLLLGRSESEGTARVGRVAPCVNGAGDPGRRFTISPEALLTAHRRAYDRGERVVGTYHSHPRGAAVPSRLDRESAWPDASYLIVGVDEEGVGDRRSWRLAEERFVQELLVVRVFEDEELPA